MACAGGSSRVTNRSTMCWAGRSTRCAAIAPSGGTGRGVCCAFWFCWHHQHDVVPLPDAAPAPEQPRLAAPPPEKKARCASGQQSRWSVHRSAGPRRGGRYGGGWSRGYSCAAIGARGRQRPHPFRCSTCLIGSGRGTGSSSTNRPDWCHQSTSKVDQILHDKGVHFCHDTDVPRSFNSTSSSIGPNTMYHHPI